MTANTSFQIDDDCVVLPDPTWVWIWTVRNNATDPDYIAKLTQRLYEWLGETGRVGTVLDDRDCLGLFREVLEFETPDFDIVPLPVCHAQQLATRYSELFGLNIDKVSEGRYRIEMDDWADVSDTPPGGVTAPAH